LDREGRWEPRREIEGFGFWYSGAWTGGQATLGYERTETMELKARTEESKMTDRRVSEPLHPGAWSAPKMTLQPRA
jgi:hypothetical protein